MSFQPPQSSFTATRQEFAAARSDWLDEFARLEAAIAKCWRHHDPSSNPKASTAQRLLEIRKLKASAPLPRARATELHEIAADAESLLPLRAAIVHSAMSIGTREGTAVALFQNACDASRNRPVFTALTAQDFVQSRDRMKQLTKRFAV